MRPDRYTIAIILHWLIAAAIVTLLTIGLTMTSLDPSMTQFRLHQLHKSIGITVLALSLLRLTWRLTHRPPPRMTSFGLGKANKHSPPPDRVPASSDR